MKKVFLDKLWDGTKIYIVDGFDLRHHHTEFELGGHGFVYDYIPKNEIWVEDMKNVEDRRKNLAHEIFEYTLMKYGKAGYETAHKCALSMEAAIRK